MNKLVLSTAYFAPVSYFRLLAGYNEVYIELHENYLKQTYRNRCQVYSSGGILQLSVPVVRGSFHKVAIKELEIDYTREWQRLHLRALKAAYSSSAFYEFYIDEIAEVIERRHRFLVDLNMEVTGLLCEMVGIDPLIRMTDKFIPEYNDATDRRYDLTPKGTVRAVPEQQEYFQVFSPEHGFIPDLSILDLLFNLGPESYGYLK